MQSDCKAHFYGPLARLTLWGARLFSHKYTCDFSPSQNPAIYVCRHLNMHGPYTTLKWLPFQAHPFSLHIFFDRETAIAHYRNYTFAKRVGKSAKKHSFKAWISGTATCGVLKSLQAIPTFRDANALKTIREAQRHLLNGEKILIWPDIAYTAGYDQPCKIYNGFLLLGELYFRKTGKPLEIIPLYVDDANRRIVARPALTLTDYKKECESITQALEKALNP